MSKPTPAEAEANFRRIVGIYAPKLMQEGFGFGKYDVCSIFGNAGHESYGMMLMQETTPVVKGSRGGFGWHQWTGSRRVAFENWCAQKGLKVTSDEANYGFMVWELETTERKAVSAVKNLVKLDDKVEAFEKAYLRAGVKHYPERKRWARIALDVMNFGKPPVDPDIPKDALTPPPPPIPPVVTEKPKSNKVAVGGAIIAAIVALGAWLLHWIGVTPQ